MPEAPEIDVLKLLNETNDWWAKGVVAIEKAPPLKRRDYYKLREELEQPEITAIIGPRQVGKTTLMHQLIEYLLWEREQRVSPKQVLYVQMDTLLDQPGMGNLRIEELLDIYMKNILKKPFNEPGEKTFIFLDEIQKVKNWNQQLKSLYDLRRNIKFVVSGSSSNNIMMGSAEALTGRLSLNVVLPIKYVDVVSLKHEEWENSLTPLSLGLRKSFAQSISEGNPERFYAALEEANKQLIPKAERLQIDLDRYLVVGGYPLTLVKRSFSEIAKALNDYTHLAIYKDIIALFDVRGPSEVIDRLLALIAQESPHVESYESIGNTLEIQRPTVKKYLQYLEEAFLINQSSVYTKNIRKQQKSLKKICLVDNGVRNALLGLLTENLSFNPEEMGKLAEMTVNNHLRRLKFNLEKTPRPQVDYWKNGHEVDNVLTLYNKPLPVEVKYKNELTEKGARGVKAFMEEFKPPFGLIVTKNQLKKEGNLLFVPLWLFLLMC